MRLMVVSVSGFGLWRGLLYWGQLSQGRIITRIPLSLLAQVILAQWLAAGTPEIHLHLCRGHALAGLCELDEGRLSVLLTSLCVWRSEPEPWQSRSAAGCPETFIQTQR